MILAIIVVIILLLIISVHFSGKHLVEVEKQKTAYGWFVLSNLLIFVSGIIVIYFITRHDEKGVRFLVLTLGFILTQIILAIGIALIVGFVKKKKNKLQ